MSQTAHRAILEPDFHSASKAASCEKSRATAALDALAKAEKTVREDEAALKNYHARQMLFWRLEIIALVIGVLCGLILAGAISARLIFSSSFTLALLT